MSTPLARIPSVVLSVILFLVFSHGDVSGFYEKTNLNPGAFSIGELESAIGECRNQSHVLDKQIQNIQKDIEWLNLKVSRIKDSGRQLSHRLKVSVISKEKRITRLINDKKKLGIKLTEYQEVYQAKMNGGKPISIKPDIAAVDVPDGAASRGKDSDIAMAVKKAGLDDWVEVLNADGSCTRMNNSLPILFSSGSAVLSKEYKPFLKKLARFLKPYNVKVYVNGFADSDPIRTPKYPSNLELGASRAANIVHQMVRYGLKPDIFKISSTGEYRFAAKILSHKKAFQRRATVTVIFAG